MTTELLTIAFLVFVLAGSVKGLVGIGLPVTAVGILSQFTDPRTAVLAAIFPIVTSNLWQVYRSGGVGGAIKRYWPFASVLAVTLFATTFVAPGVSADMLVLILGIVIVIFAITNLAFKSPELPDRYDTLAQIVAGAVAGVSGGLTAIWAPPMVIYFLARGLDKEEFIRASSLIFLCGSIPLLAGYIQNGLITADIAKLSALMVVPTLIGFVIGEQLRRRLDAGRFRTAVLVMFLLMGLNLLRQSFF